MLLRCLFTCFYCVYLLLCCLLVLHCWWLLVFGDADWLACGGWYTGGVVGWCWLGLVFWFDFVVCLLVLLFWLFRVRVVVCVVGLGLVGGCV